MDDQNTPVMAKTEGGVLVPKYFELDTSSKDGLASSRYFTKADSEVPEDKIHLKYPKFRRRADLFKTLPNGVVVYRIEATIGMRLPRRVLKGSLGGWIEKDANLSRSGKSWVYDDACVYGTAEVRDDVTVQNNAMVFGQDRDFGPCVFNKVTIKDSAWVFGDCTISGLVVVKGNALIYGDHRISELVVIDGDVILNDRRSFVLDSEGEFSCQGDVDDYLIREAGKDL